MIFLGAFAAAAIVIGTVVFPFWNFIREEIIEDVEIFESANGKCYVNTSDGIPKTIDNCNIPSGTDVTVKYSDRMPKAVIYSPQIHLKFYKSDLAKYNHRFDLI